MAARGRGGYVHFLSFASAADGFAEALFIQRLRRGMQLVDNYQRGIWTVTGAPRR